MKCNIADCNSDTVDCITGWTNSNCQLIHEHCLDHEVMLHILIEKYRVSDLFRMLGGIKK
jgi:hypothetical protein